MTKQSSTGLAFDEWPIFEIGTNLFVRVPVILQYEDTPLIEVVQRVPAGYDAKIAIYHPDGTYLAKVVGSRLVSTRAGRKAGVDLKHPAHKTICLLGKQVLFEIVRREAAALKTEAELYAPDGAFLKCTNVDFRARMPGERQKPLQLGGLQVRNMHLEDSKIGIRVFRDGRVAVGIGGGQLRSRTGTTGYIGSD